MTTLKTTTTWVIYKKFKYALIGDLIGAGFALWLSNATGLTLVLHAVLGWIYVIYYLFTL